MTHRNKNQAATSTIFEAGAGGISHRTIRRTSRRVILPELRLPQYAHEMPRIPQRIIRQQSRILQRQIRWG